MIAIGDSSILIPLARINQLHLLEEMYGGVFIPQGIYDEVVIRGAGKVGSGEVENADFIHVEQVRDMDSVDEYVDPLTLEDAEVILLAKEQNADLILSNDRNLRRRALREGFVVSTIYVLLIEAKREGFLPAVKTCLDEMRNKGILIRKGIYQETLRQAGELPNEEG
ncbi:DUF3368 domain-containing protein [Candidatus Poribacteria bacterium]|nr:DUF3368 domain-containing protein [Candidatus Poribacteria bacterium]